MPKNIKQQSRRPVFIDLFSGCGGLSLGLINAGWQGLFAVERDRMAFETLRVNLIEGRAQGFSEWPTWLNQEAMPISRLITKHEEQLRGLRGKIDLIAGGPPCQGFSTAGKRDEHDPRNKLTAHYLHIVDLVRPRFLLLENVRGFDIPFSDKKEHKKTPLKKKTTKEKNSFAQKVAAKLERLGYIVHSDMVSSSKFGVPQKRLRFIMVAIRNEDPSLDKLKDKSPFELLDEARETFLISKGLNPARPITVSQAISDLKVTGKKLIPSTDYSGRGFSQIAYSAPKKIHPYKALLRKGINGTPPADIRLPRHREDTIEFFSSVLSTCEKGKTLSKDDREAFGMKKQALTPLHPDMPSATITTLPDDILHYSEPRILTVRENARLQSFPDWFSFRGKYTTGGKKRKHECPRYTQVGNAVPPLLGEAIGVTLRTLV